MIPSTLSVPTRPRLLAALALAGAALLGACQTSPRIVGANVMVQPGARLVAINPSDIAIAPVELLVPAAGVPQESLRQAAAAFLPRKRYSPLRIENVDGALVGVEPASYRPGTLREDAVLELTVHGWDASLWSARRTLVVDLEARFVDPAAPLGEPLWTGRLSQRFDFTNSTLDAPTDAVALERACGRVVAELLAPVPARDVDPAPRTALD